MKIGLRMTGEGYNMPLDRFCAWCREQGFEAIDVQTITPDLVKTAADFGLVIGEVDLTVGGRELLSADKATRSAGIEAAKRTIQVVADHGVRVVFCVLDRPEDPTQGRAATFDLWKQTFPPIVEFAESRGIAIALEGYPGSPPYLPTLGSTPEMLRAMFTVCPSPAFGLNYDPSHLVRLGIDYERALAEFGDRVKHVHAKDTVFDQEALYLYGRLSPTFTHPRIFGEEWWRYCIPGEGETDWGRVIKRLEDHGYDGILSIELEDVRYAGSWEAEAEGFIRARAHLKRFMR